MRSESEEARIQRLFDVLLLATPTQTGSTLTRRCLVFVMSRVDYCNAVLAGVLRSIIDKLQRVLNAAARLVTDTRNFDRGLERLLHDDLHWLDVPERVQFKLGLIVRRCLRRRAPLYLVDYCISVSDIVSRQHLRSASRRQLVVLHHRLNTFGRRAFAVAGPCPGTHYRTVSASRRVMTTFQTTVSNIH